MTFYRGRSSGFSQNLKNAFLLFTALSLFLPEVSPEAAAANASEKKSGEIRVQQIGPAGGEAPLDIGKIYNLVPSSKPLRISTQFKVVDDFSSKELKNNLGGSWTIDKGQGKKVRFELKKEDARNRRSGASLGVRYNLVGKEKVVFRTSLEKLDMSAANYLILKCKKASAGPFKGRFRIALTDWAGKTVEQDITSACFESEGWSEAVLPLSAFMGVDLDQLKNLSFRIMAPSKNVAGKFAVDEIAFFGRSEVGFESVQDNLVGFPLAVLNESRRKELLATRDDEELLLKIAQDTWKYFANAADKKNKLVVDHLKVGDFPLAAAYTSPTNIGLDLMGTVSARELGILSDAQASERVRNVLKTLKNLETWKGFFFNFYETTRLNVTRRFVSSVDSAWLAVALVIVRQAFPGDIAEDATKLLDSFHFQEFLDPDNNQLRIGYDVEQDRPTPYHYGMLVSEARIASIYGIGKGDLPEEHWWYLYRTAPEAWDWQTQKPHGKEISRGKISYFQGYYKDGAKKFVPSWGGSLFEFLMPTMVIEEQKAASDSLGANDKTVTEIHRDYALKEKKYPVWGISPAATADGRRWMYGEYGIKRLGVKGYPDQGVITPHVSFLALETLPKDAIKNIRKFLTYAIYGEYGFYDSITFPSQRINTQYLALDQGMVLIPIANYLKKGVIQEYFHKDPVGKKARELLKQESFF